MSKNELKTKRIKQEKILWEEQANKGCTVYEPPRPVGSPVDHAFSLSQWYCDKYSADYRKKRGQFFTPPEVAGFMASLASKESFYRVLDPGAGTGILSCAIIQRALELSIKYPIEIAAYEPDEHLSNLLEASLEYASQVITENGGFLKYRIIRANFVQDVLEKSLNLDHHLEDVFANYSLVIANPPYFKLRPEDISVRYAEGRLEGATNIYSLIMGLSAKLLTKYGEMIFIVPRSFASGAYFRKFRKQLLLDVNLNYIHVFESRKEAFKGDGVLQENIIVKLSKKSTKGGIYVSNSTGATDIEKSRRRVVPLDKIYDPQSEDQIISIPLNELNDAVVDIVNSWDGSLHKYGMEISTGPVVSHRSLGWITDAPPTGKPVIPLLWMQNMKAMFIQWPLTVTRKQQYVVECPEAERWLLPDGNYVLLRRFSAKEEPRRLTAAPLLKGRLGCGRIGIENHLNYIHKPGNTIEPDEAFGLAALLNSKLMDIYFRVFSGNTQVSATEIRGMPLPSHDVLKKIGKRVRAIGSVLKEEQIETIVCEEVGVTKEIWREVLEEINGKDRRSTRVA